jgi:hypothetical protein
VNGQVEGPFTVVSRLVSRFWRRRDGSEGRGRVDFTLERTVAFFRLKITQPFSAPWEGQKRLNATIQELCCQLKDLTERLRGGSRGVSVGRVDVGKGGIEGAVPEVLANQEGIRALLDHEHRGGVLQNVRML